MSCTPIKSVDEVNQKKKFFLSPKKYKNLKRDKFVELGDRGLKIASQKNCVKFISLQSYSFDQT